MPGERNPTLDILRGFALFGVLLSNLNHYSPTHPSSASDNAVWWAQQWLIQNRFYSLLGFLFGIGFAIQLGRAEAQGRDVGPVFYRRMFVLLLFGIVHGMFIWDGDILTKFAVVGLFLPLYRRFSPRGLLVAAVATWFGAAYAQELLWRILALPPLPPHPDWTRLYTSGTYAEILPARITDYVANNRMVILNFGLQSADFLALFILGLWAVRSGLVANVGERLSSLRRAFWVALVCITVGFILNANIDAWWPPLRARPTWGSPHFWNARFVLRFGVPRFLITWGTAAAYAILLTLLAQRARVRAALGPLAAVGRMSLTTYLTQSVISTLLFYGYGLGWLGRVSYTGMLAIACVIFGAQLASSTWWFRHYRFGPAEWFWRSLSYWKKQPMRVAT